MGREKTGVEREREMNGRSVIDEPSAIAFRNLRTSVALLPGIWPVDCRYSVVRSLVYMR